MTDVAEAMLPGAETRVVGIRPGEKLHEVMITDDDSRATLELPDRFVIEPTFEFWNHRSYVTRGAVPVPEMFRYASDSNTEWLSVEDIRDLLKRENHLPS
jgi:UDP-N-acetylglucosamine 4,6-dehydratase